MSIAAPPRGLAAAMAPVMPPVGRATARRVDASVLDMAFVSRSRAGRAPAGTALSDTEMEDGLPDAVLGAATAATASLFSMSMVAAADADMLLEDTLVAMEPTDACDPLRPMRWLPMRPPEAAEEEVLAADWDVRRVPMPEAEEEAENALPGRVLLGPMRRVLLVARGLTSTEAAMGAGTAAVAACSCATSALLDAPASMEVEDSSTCAAAKSAACAEAMLAGLEERPPVIPEAGESGSAPPYAPSTLAAVPETACTAPQEEEAEEETEPDERRVDAGDMMLLRAEALRDMVM